jgi:hypothetical protein
MSSRAHPIAHGQQESRRERETKRRVFRVDGNAIDENRVFSIDRRASSKRYSLRRGLPLIGCDVQLVPIGIMEEYRRASDPDSSGPSKGIPRSFKA